MIFWVGVSSYKAAVIAVLKDRARQLTHKPRIYFEEWDDPLISGIRWVSELIEVAGGSDCFAENALQPLGKNRIIADPCDVIARQPDIIIGSWCGKKFRPKRVAQRPGWDQIPAVQNGHIYEIKSAEILQPGPACLTDGLNQLLRIITLWQDDPHCNSRFARTATDSLPTD